MGVTYAPVSAHLERKLENARLKMDKMPVWTIGGHQLALEGVYVSDIALCIALTDGRSSSVDDQDVSVNGIGLSQLIGTMMRTAMGLAQQVGLFMPCFCILFLSDRDLYHEASRLMQNQDWHRGDFALLVYHGDENGKGEKIARVIGSLSYHSFRSNLQPIDTGFFIDGVNHGIKRKGEELTVERRDLLERIKAILLDLDKKGILDDDKAFASELEKWVDLHIRDIERQLTRNEAAGS